MIRCGVIVRNDISSKNDISRGHRTLDDVAAEKMPDTGVAMTVFQWITLENVPGNVRGNIPHAPAAAGLGDAHVNVRQVARVVVLPRPDGELDHFACPHRHGFGGQLRRAVHPEIAVPKIAHPAAVSMLYPPLDAVAATVRVGDPGRHRHDAIVRPKHRRTQPIAARNVMRLARVRRRIRHVQFAFVVLASLGRNQDRFYPPIGSAPRCA